MKVIKNSLSENLTERCLEEIKQLQNDPVWRSSSICWPEWLKNGISGSCLIVDSNKEVKKQILDQIQSYLPKTSNDISIMFYVWQPGSGMSKHLDSAYKFAATIYLNSYWNIEWGGNFLYYNKTNIDWNTPENEYMYDHDNWKLIVPEYRTMVVNTDKMLHMVTPISSFVPELRYTIQIFAS